MGNFRETYFVSSVMCALGHRAEKRCHFQIAWSINPHMVVGSSQVDLAVKQHQGLKDTLKTAGANVVEVPFVCDNYDSVFVKDNALLLEDKGRKFAFMGEHHHSVRKGEQSARARIYEKMGFSVLQLPHGLKLEGGDLVLASPGIFLGHGFRSDERSAYALEDRTGIKVQALKLVNPYLYHLDTALSVLKDGTAVVCSEAFDSESYKRIKKSSWITRIIDVSIDEAKAFGCNLVQVGDTVIMGSFLPRLMRALREAGFRPKYTSLSEFQRAGGSAACLVSEVHDRARVLTTVREPAAVASFRSAQTSRLATSASAAGSLSTS